MFNGGQKITNAAVAVARVELNNEIAAGVRQSQLDNIQTQSTNRRLEKQLREKANKAEYYDWLLHQPIEVMARKHGVFRNNLENFLKQKEMNLIEIYDKNNKQNENNLIDWIVFAKATQALLYKNNLKNNISLDKTYVMIIETILEILDDKYEKDFNVGVSKVDKIQDKKNDLKLKFNNLIIQLKEKQK